MKRRLTLLAFGLAACSHAEPFPGSDPIVNGPSINPAHLTLNTGNDQWALWQDENTIWYSAQDSLAHDRDHCLVSIPAASGTYTARQCPPAAQNNLTEILQQPTILDGVLAYARADLGTFPPEHVQYRFGIWTAGLGRNAPHKLVMSFPYIAPSGKNHDALINLRWVRPGVLAYIGAEAGCCNKDTLRFGEQIVLLDISGAAPVRTFIPDSYRASALGVSTDGLSLYYTVYGDHRVYQRVIASGVVTVLHDFGVGRVVRDPDIAGNRLVAVIDGLHNFGDSPPFENVSVDKGGELILVDLASGAETPVLDNQRYYKRPRFSPTGDRIVAEGYPYHLNLHPFPDPAVDTIVSRSADLWILEE